MATWSLDSAHSELGFKVKHMMIANVTGLFEKFDVALEGDDTLASGKITVTVKTGSVNTKNEQRDGHLRSADFFESEKFEDMVFASESFNRGGNDEFEVPGTLTIKGISKPVTLNVEFGGINKDPWGNTKAGFSFSAKINRKDWNLVWNAALETGGVLVGDEVKIFGEAQFAKVG